MRSLLERRWDWGHHAWDAKSEEPKTKRLDNRKDRRRSRMCTRCQISNRDNIKWNPTKSRMTGEGEKETFQCLKRRWSGEEARGTPVISSLSPRNLEKKKLLFPLILIISFNSNITSSPSPRLTLQPKRIPVSRSKETNPSSSSSSLLHFSLLSSSLSASRGRREGKGLL